MFVTVAWLLCIISQLPNLGSLKKTFEAFFEHIVYPKTPEGEDEPILINQGTSDQNREPIVQALKYSDMRVSSVCIDRPEFSKLKDQLHFSVLKLIAQDGFMVALQVFYLRSF